MTSLSIQETLLPIFEPKIISPTSEAVSILFGLTLVQFLTDLQFIYPRFQSELSNLSVFFSTGAMGEYAFPLKDLKSRI